MRFLNFSNINILFLGQERTWRSYISAKALSTTKQVELIDIKEFTKVILDKKIVVFVVHVTASSLSNPTIIIYLAKKTKIASLIAKKFKIPTKYTDLSNVFSKEKALVLPELNNLNKYAIKLQKD